MTTRLSGRALSRNANLHSNDRSRRASWLAGAAVGSVLATVFAASGAAAQSAAPDRQVEEVVVTGTSIRGEQPVGSDLISLTREEILRTGATTTQELLRKVPALNAFNTQVRQGLNASTGVGTPPGLRGLNANATLVLLDGQRLIAENPLSTVPDPSSIPAAAIQRVEIVADGASAIYGSDAVAGVINIITRKDLDGFETSLTKGWGQHGYDFVDLSQAIGKTWTGGGVMVVAAYNQSNHLANYDLPFYREDLREFGAADLRSTNCLAPNVRFGATTYAPPSYAAGTAARCISNTQLADSLPANRRTSVLANIHQDVTEKLSVWGELKYAATYTTSLSASATPSVTIPSTNPFFFRPPGAVGTSEVVSANLLPITGVIRNHAYAKAMNAIVGADYNLPHDFRLQATVNYGKAENAAHSPAFDAVSLAAAAAGTTTATAYDPFGTRTSAAVAAAIANNENLFSSDQTFYDYQAKVDGPLFSLPGGEVKVAVGVDYRKYTYAALNTVGPFGLMVNPGIVDAERTIKAVFGEALVPLIGPDNAIPFVRALTFSAAVRHDEYSDFGNTTNPKYGVTWVPLEGLVVRASYGKSFHAPDMGDSYAVDTRANFLPNTGLVPPGQPVQDVLIFAGGNPGLQPETAKTYSVGAEFSPVQFPGFRASLTYWNITYSDLIRVPPISPEVYSNPAFAQFVVTNPTRAFLDEVARTFRVVNTTVPIPLVNYVVDLRRHNLGAVETDGIDYEASYRWGTDAGDFVVGVSGSRTFDFLLKGASNAPFASQNNFIKTRVRGEAGWTRGPLAANAAVNFSGRYNQTYTTSAGTVAEQSVKPFTTVDLRAAYTLPDRFGLGGATLSVTADNLFDKDPPPLYVAPGFSQLASVLGRVVSVGLVKKW